jgi:uncharacterized damage-inducible protein DinB
MIATSNARMLARYSAWANTRIFDSVAGLPPGEADKQRSTLFKTMIGTLNHNYVVDLIWQAHLEGREHGFKARNMVLHPELTGLRAAQSKLDAWFVSWSDSQTEETLAEKLDFRFVSGKAGRMTRLEMLQHVVTHKAYHLGWVAEMFFEVPAKVLDMDLPVFLGEAKRDWE